MKKLLFILFAVLVASGVSAQKIKIEKKTGLVSVDNVNVARIVSSKNAEKQDVYTFTDLNSDDWVTLTMVKLDKDGDSFLQVSSSLSDKTSEMDWELLTFTLSMNSGIANLIVKKHQFFTTDGMNKDAIVQFLDTQSKKHLRAHQQKVEARQAIQSEIDAFAPTFSGRDLSVINKNTGDILIKFEDPTGRYDRYRNSDTDYAGFVFKDHKDNVIGLVRKSESRNGLPSYSIETYDSKTYNLGEVSSTALPVEVAKRLILSKYMGEGENSLAYRQQLEAEELAARRAKAQADEEEYDRRITVNGILTLDDGTVLDGIFKVEFRQTPDGIVKKEKGNIISLDGKTLRHYYQDEKGKDKVKIYKEKQISSFRVVKEDEPDYDEYYCTIEYQSDGKTKKALVYRIADMRKTCLYLAGNTIFIQHKGNNTTLELTRRKFEEQLKTIASDCPSVIETVAKHEYMYHINSIHTYAEDYDRCAN